MNTAPCDAADPNYKVGLRPCRSIQRVVWCKRHRCPSEAELCAADSVDPPSFGLRAHCPAPVPDASRTELAPNSQNMSEASGYPRMAQRFAQHAARAQAPAARRSTRGRRSVQPKKIACVRGEALGCRWCGSSLAGQKLDLPDVRPEKRALKARIRKMIRVSGSAFGREANSGAPPPPPPRVETSRAGCTVKIWETPDVVQIRALNARFRENKSS